MAFVVKEFKYCLPKAEERSHDESFRNPSKMYESIFAPKPGFVAGRSNKLPLPHFKETINAMVQFNYLQYPTI
jgi:hypothetical protein